MEKPPQLIVQALIGFSVFLLLFLSRDSWREMDLRAYDLRLQAVERLDLARPDTARPTGKVVVVGMEEKALLKEKPLVFWYPEIGMFLRKMDEFGAGVVGIDVIPVHALGEKMADAARSVVSSGLAEKHGRFLDELGRQTDNSLLGPLLEVSGRIKIVQGVADENVPYYYGLLAFMENVRPASVKLTIDEDQGIRRQRVIYDENLWSFPHAVSVASGGDGDIGEPVVLINYLIEKDIPYYSFTDVLRGRHAGDKFAGKTVLLGYITTYDDIHSTPLGRRLPGVKIHAAAVETLLGRSFLRIAPLRCEAAVLFFLTAAGLVAAIALRPALAVFASLSLMAAYALFNLFLFSRGHVAALFPHVLSPLLVLTFVYPYRYFVEERSRKKIYRTFSYYMDGHVIDTLITKSPESLLRGERQELCIFFLDIRDFTALAHEEEPENIIAFLNRFFGLATEIIQRHEGFVNKFIGDAVLAFFGSERAVDNALRAAAEIVEGTGKINRDVIFSKPWTLRIGIGIHWGGVIVGNIGSEKKMDFTIIGDSVNIASRVEGLTKRLDRAVLVTETAYRRAGREFDLENLGEFKIRGIEKPVAVYSPKDEKPTKQAAEKVL